MKTGEKKREVMKRYLHYFSPRGKFFFIFCSFYYFPRGFGSCFGFGNCHLRPSSSYMYDSKLICFVLFSFFLFFFSFSFDSIKSRVISRDWSYHCRETL